MLKGFRCAIILSLVIFAACQDCDDFTKIGDKIRQQWQDTDRGFKKDYSYNGKDVVFNTSGSVNWEYPARFSLINVKYQDTKPQIFCSQRTEGDVTIRKAVYSPIPIWNEVSSYDLFYKNWLGAQTKYYSQMNMNGEMHITITKRVDATGNFISGDVEFDPVVITGAINYICHSVFLIDGSCSQDDQNAINAYFTNWAKNTLFPEYKIWLNSEYVKSWPFDPFNL